MTWLKNFIQGIPSWVTGFDSHWGVVAFLTLFVALKWPHALWPAIAVAEVGFAIKEFYIDKHFETTHQTFMMNLTDFGSYTLGVVSALIAKHFL